MKYVILVVAVVAVLYYLFRQKGSKKQEIDEMLECEGCGIYVQSQEMLRVRGHTYCSKECAQRAKR